MSAIKRFILRHLGIDYETKVSAETEKWVERLITAREMEGDFLTADPNAEMLSGWNMAEPGPDAVDKADYGGWELFYVPPPPVLRQQQFRRNRPRTYHPRYSGTSLRWCHLLVPSMR